MQHKQIFGFEDLINLTDEMRDQIGEKVFGLL